MNWRSQAWRNLWRDARAGELRLLLIAVVLGLAGLSAVAFLADRIQAGLQRDAAQLLGGDVVVVSDQPTPEALQQRARDEGLRGVITLSFPTMARTDAQESQLPRTRLVALKAVQPGYPLRGTLQTSVQRASDDRWQAQPTRDLPAPGEAWVDAALLDALGLQLGDPLWLGDSRLRLSRVLVREPDRGAGFMNFAPRVMIHDADLAATGLVQPASRITWRYALVGAPDAVARYAAWAEAYSQRDAVRGVRVETLEAGRPEMRQTLDRASQFLRLVALLAALLSAVAVALAARSFAARHLDECALLRVFGVSQRDMAWMYAAEFVLIGTVASALGLLLGYGLHALLVLGLAGLIETELPAPGWTPVWLGGGVGMTLLFGGMVGGLSVAFDKDAGTMRLLVTSPVRHVHVLLAKALSAAVAALLQTFLLLLALAFFEGLYWLLQHFGFDLRAVLPWTGYLMWPNLALVLPVLCVSAISCGLLGVAVGVTAKTIDSFAVMMNFVIFPLFFLSGALYPIAPMPTLARWVASISQPVADCVRGRWLPSSVWNRSGCTDWITRMYCM